MRGPERILDLAVLLHESVLVSEPANEGAGDSAASCRIAADAGAAPAAGHASTALPLQLA